MGVLRLRLVMPKDAKGRVVVRQDALKLGETAQGESFLVRAWVRGVDAETGERVERVTTYAPLIIERNDYEGSDHG